MAAAGARVAVTARQKEAVIDVAAACGYRSLPLSLEASDERSCVRAIRGAEEEFGQLDILVNNAGIAESAKFLETDTAMWHRTLAVNLNGPFWMTRTALPGMLRRGHGRVISIGSVGSRIGLAYASAYTVSKHGLLGLTRALATEFPRSGVTFNCVCPHYVDTPMTDTTISVISSKTGRSVDEAREALLTPQGTLIDPMDVADLCVLLASAAGRMITGQGIQVDGGEVQA